MQRQLKRRERRSVKALAARTPARTPAELLNALYGLFVAIDSERDDPIGVHEFADRGQTVVCELKQRLHHLIRIQGQTPRTRSAILAALLCVLCGLLLNQPEAQARNLRPLLNAIREVESGGDPRRVGDHGRSLGPYQIQRPYWRDSGVPGNYDQVRNTAYAERVVLAYWRKHAVARASCPWSGSSFERLARIHNGGPTGDHKSATLPYWQKVKRKLAR